MAKTNIRLHLSCGKMLDFTSELPFDGVIDDIFANKEIFALDNIVINPMHIVAVENVTQDDTVKGIPITISGGNKVCS